MVRSCPSCGAGLEREGTCAACAARAAGGALPPRYEPIRPLGRGGMATVVLCRDTELGVEVAVKCLPPELARDSRAADELRREGNAAARLRGSPGVLSIYDLTEHAGAWILVMEYAPGGSLRERLRRDGPLPEEECRRIGEEVLAGLAAAHAAGVLHRDIKPENVLFDAAGHAKIADFGIARVLAETSARRTQAGAHGTPSYMAPELFLTPGADARADVYALGATLFEMATGRPPFEGTYAAAASRALRGTRAPDLRTLRPELSLEFASFVARLLEPDPALRPADAVACAAILRGEEPAAPPVRRRRKLGFAGIAAAAVLLLAVTAAVIAARPEKAPVPGPRAQTPDASGSTELRDTPPPQTPDPPRPAVPDTPTVVPAPTASFLVVTDPPGATVYVDGREKGVAPREGLVVEGLDPAALHQVRAMLDGYGPEVRSALKVQANTRTEIRLVLPVLTGTIRFDGGPAGAAVWIARAGEAQREHVLAQNGSFGPLALPIGEYVVTLSRPGFDARQEPVRVENGRTTFVDARLVQRAGILGRVVTDPPGAEVWVGAKLLGTTPLEAGPLAPGTHVLRITHPAADAVEREVVLVADQLTPVAPVTLALFGTIDLGGLEKGVTAKIDGNVVTGTVRSAPRKVEITFKKDDKHVDQKIEVTVLPGTTVAPTVGPWKAAKGFLTVNANGGMAYLGSSVLSGRVEVQAGMHMVKFTRAGYQDQTKTVTVVADQDASVSAGPWVPTARSRDR